MNNIRSQRSINTGFERLIIDIVNTQFLSEKAVKIRKIDLSNMLSMVRLLKSFLLIIDELFKLEIGKQFTRDAESSSLSLCTAHFILLPSEPAVTSNALAIRIVFPLVGGTRLLTTGWVCPPCRANKKRPARNRPTYPQITKQAKTYPDTTENHSKKFVFIQDCGQLSHLLLSL